MLRIRNLVVKHKEIIAIKGVSLHISEGEIVTLIGNNGAGKTTLLEAIAGLNRNITGEIKFCGNDISRSTPAQIVSDGISLVPEGRQIFNAMSVTDNIILGAYNRLKKEKLNSIDFNFIYDIFPILKQRAHQMAGTLSGGEQQMLAIARALMAKPKILLLDEPSTGLAPLIVKEIFKILKDLNEKSKLTILIIEQNAKLALEYSSRGYVLETGLIISEGESKELMQDENIIRAYLGKNYNEVTD